jgi:hypothetical protein
MEASGSIHLRFVRLLYGVNAALFVEGLLGERHALDEPLSPKAVPACRKWQQQGRRRGHRRAGQAELDEARQTVRLHRGLKAWLGNCVRRERRPQQPPMIDAQFTATLQQSPASFEAPLTTIRSSAR